MIKEYLSKLKQEFTGYSPHSFTADLLAGITVAAVALPLALAFGVSSGADAAAGLITAITAALIIGSLSGASYQISGPTGAMAVILVPLAAKYGLTTVFAAGALSGILLICAGVLKAGRIISFIPKAVITGFTSGIAIIIALGQIENFTGVQSYGEEAYMRIFNMLAEGFSPNGHAVGIGLFVVVLMLVWPKKWGTRIPASLIAIIITTVMQIFFKFDIATVGAIPKTLIHDTRLSFADIFNVKYDVIIMPAVSIAALGMIESLLCGAVAGKMKGEKLQSDQELVAQGIGNVILPFIGGVPATAAIARTSVAIKSGSRTRLTGIIHGVILLFSMFMLNPFMSQIPMPALAGVLIVTAWRMNEWANITYIFKNRFKGAIVKFTTTLLCTVIFDLTMAIALGSLAAMCLFIARVSDIEVTVSEFDSDRSSMDMLKTSQMHVQIIYVTGSIFFGSADNFAGKIREATGTALILSMRGVPDVDISGAQELYEFCKEKKDAGVQILFCGVQPKVKEFMHRAGVLDLMGENSLFWDAEAALQSLNNAPAAIQ